MKRTILLFGLLIVFSACEKEEETEVPSETTTTTETEFESILTLVVAGDTIQTDSVYTRRTANESYQVAGVDEENRLILLTMYHFEGELMYFTNYELIQQATVAYCSIELRNYNGASFTSTYPLTDGFINVTDYSADSETVSGSFGGTLNNADNSNQTLVIDTAYFENITPLILETEPGKADVFTRGELVRNIEAVAEVKAYHGFLIHSVEDPLNEGFYVLINGVRPEDQWIGLIQEWDWCFSFYESHKDHIFVQIDSTSQTASGHIKDPNHDTSIHFNEVPVSFPEIPIESDKLNLLYDGTILSFEDYHIESQLISSVTREVNVEAWSSNGEYLTVSMDFHFPFSSPYCIEHLYRGTMRLYESEISTVPIMTFEGTGNLTVEHYQNDRSDFGFVSGDTKLSGVDLLIN